MVKITYKKKGIRVTQIWYPEEMRDFSETKTDIVFCHGVYQKKHSKALYQTFHTLISDLTEVDETLFSRINKNVRYEIRRNNKENVEYKVFQSKDLLEKPDVLNSFSIMYENMYAEKGMKQSLNLEQLRLYAREEALLVSGIYVGEQPVVMHSYIVAEKKVRLLHSVSEFRRQDMDANFIARCNKRLHWDDLKYLAGLGKTEYDWGGVSSLENPNGIDAFKFKFGGTPSTYYNEYVGKSWLGKMVLGILKSKWKN